MLILNEADTIDAWIVSKQIHDALAALPSVPVHEIEIPILCLTVPS